MSASATSPQGDILEAQWTRAGPLLGESPNYYSNCQQVLMYGGQTWVSCGQFYLWDATSSTHAAPTSNNSSTTIYDACGVAVTGDSGSGWYSVGSNPASIGPGTIRLGSAILGVPLTGVCYGPWTLSYTFNQTFTSGASLSATALAIFEVWPDKRPP